MKLRLCMHPVWAAGLLLIAGCRGYEVHNPDSTLKLHLDQIQNNSQAALVTAPLARELRQILATSPNVVLVNEDNADGSLKITITSMDRQTSARDPKDSGRPATFSLTLNAKLEWVEFSKPAPWGASQSRVDAEAQAMAQPSLVDAEYQIMPSIFDKLAEKIAHRVLYPWEN